MKDREIQFVEKLLRGYAPMKAERFNLNIKWGILERQRNNAIEAKYLTAAAYDGIPGPPRNGYRAAPLLLTGSEEVKAIEDEQSFIKDRLIDLEDMIAMVDQALLSLTPRDMDIVISFYINGFSMRQIAQKIPMHETWVRTCKQRSLRAMYKSLRCMEGTVIFK